MQIQCHDLISATPLERKKGLMPTPFNSECRECEITLRGGRTKRVYLINSDYASIVAVSQTGGEGDIAIRVSTLLNHLFNSAIPEGHVAVLPQENYTSSLWKETYKYPGQGAKVLRMPRFVMTEAFSPLHA